MASPHRCPRTVAALLALLVVTGLGALSSRTAQAATQNEDAGPYEVGAWPENPQSAAVYRDGNLHAGPFESIRDLVVLDDDTIVLTDPALGFVVGVGGRFGQDQQRPELAAKHMLLDQVVDAGEVGLLPSEDGGRVVIAFAGGRLVLESRDLEAVLSLEQVDEDPRGLAPARGGGVWVCSGTDGTVLFAGADPSAPDAPTVVPVATVPGANEVFVVPAEASPSGREQLVVIVDPDATAPRGAGVGDATPGGDTGDERVVLVSEPASGETPFDVVELPADATVNERLDELRSLASQPNSPAYAEFLTAEVLDPAAAAQTPTTTETPSTSQPPGDEGLEPDDAPLPTTGEEADPEGAALATLLLVIFLVLFGLPALVLLGRAVTARETGGHAPFGDPTNHDDATAPKPSAAAAPTRHRDAGSVDVVPKDPCDELREAADAAENACGAARQDAARARAAADAAKADAGAAAKAAKAAGKRAKAAARELAAAQQVPEEGSSISDDEGKVTQHDLGLKRAASRAALERWRNGEITAGELESTWEELGDRDAIEALRKQDAAFRAHRLAAAEQAQAEAQATSEAAAEQATSTAEAATEAGAAAEEADARATADCRDAEAKRAAADECEGRMREAYAEQEEQRRTEDATRREELEEEERRFEEEGPTFLGDKPGGSGQADPMCCPCGTWVIYGSQVAGMAAVWGQETTKIWAVCTCNSAAWVEMTCTTTRWGLGLGGEANAVGGIAFGLHASEIPGAIEGALNGVNWDLSLGASAAKAAKGAAKGARVAAAMQAIKGVARKGAKPADLMPGDLKKLNDAAATVGEMARGAGTAGGAASVKQGVQQHAAGGVGALVIPVGAGVQVGLWLGASTKVYVTDYASCGCIVSGG